MPAKSTTIIKEVLGEIPWTAELYWLMRQKGKTFNSHFTLKGLEEHLPDLMKAVKQQRAEAEPGKKIFVFATLHYWIEHAALLSLALAAQGHEVFFAYLPYSEWQVPINKFDLRRQGLYAHEVLKQLTPLVHVISLMKINTEGVELTQSMQSAVTQVTEYDTQYTLQVEDVDPENEIYQLRKKRNKAAAKAFARFFREHKMDAVVVPNGTIQEMGVAYRIARIMKIPVTTYEFGEQRQTIWLAHNDEIMQQNTDDMWNACRDIPLSEKEKGEVRELFIARRKADLYGNFARRWQSGASQGGQKVRQALGLDDRPVILLATNVLGDSLTLGRNIFSRSMAEWVSRTIQYFAGRDDIQLVVRIHPGEVLTHGMTMGSVVRDVLPELPENIHLIGAQDPTNTYDLMEIASLGLVFTTTVGLEMAMTGVPVIVAGKTHYRNRGFTLDPATWVEYYKTLGRVITDPEAYRLTEQTVDLAWQYAYRFFFDFARPCPWHLVRVWDDYAQRPLDQVLSASGKELYQDTFDYFSGMPIDWDKIFSAYTDDEKEAER